MCVKAIPRTALLLSKSMLSHVLQKYLSKTADIFDSSNAVVGMAFTQRRKGDSVLYGRDKLCTAWQTKQKQSRHHIKT